MRELGKLRALRADERRTLARALVATPLIVIGLRLVGFERARAALARLPSGVPTRCDWTQDAAIERARVVARMAGIATGRGPVRATCLRRSLLTWWLLRGDGIDVAVRVGVRLEGGVLHAHAWVEHRGIPLGEADDPGSLYAPFDPDFGSTIRARS